MGSITKHLCVEIEWEIERIIKTWKTVFNCTPQEALQILSIARNEWKTYYSWCDNMNKEWRCGWHKVDEKID